MSWDISVTHARDHESWRQGDDVWDRNVTYNNSRILEKALGCHFRDLDGQEAGVVLDRLTPAIRHILRHRADYADLEPPNGWGGIVDVLDVLRQLRNVCEEYPDLRVMVV